MHSKTRKTRAAPPVWPILLLACSGCSEFLSNFLLGGEPLADGVQGTTVSPTDPYDDCDLSRCVSLIAFHDFTLNTYYANGDIGFTGQSYRCADPNTFRADIHILVPANAADTLSDGGFLNQISQAQFEQAALGGAERWGSQIPATQVRFRVNPTTTTPEYAGDINIVPVAPLDELAYTGSELGVFGQTTFSSTAPGNTTVTNIEIWSHWNLQPNVAEAIPWTETGSGSTSANPKFSLTAGLAHEVGHAIGLGHVNPSTQFVQPEDLMRTAIPFGSFHSVSPVDYEAAKYLYPTSNVAQQRKEAAACLPRASWL